jgi:hypothetical protein
LLKKQGTIFLISGYLTNYKTGRPEANIYLKRNKKISTSNDKSGHYTLQVPGYKCY